ncbi:MAG: hypothetical protein ACXWRZ_15735 [Bdellovibrio sp.]
MTENLKKAFNNLNNNFRLNVIVLSINKSDGINELKSFKDHHELPKQWSFAVIKDEAEAKDFLKSLNYQFEKSKYGFDHPNAAFLFSAKKRWSGVFVGLDNKSEDLEKAILSAEQFDNDSLGTLFSRYIKQPEFFIYIGLSGLLICFGIIFSILFGKKLKAKNAN